MNNKFEYIVRTLSRTKRKDYENYVVNAIWNRLNTSELKPVSQQYIKHSEGYYLIDLYFPQLNIGVECDEWYHKQNQESDKQREITIFDILKQIRDTSNYLPLHVDITKSYEEIECEINSCVHTILSHVEKQKKNGTFSKWEDVSPKEYFADKLTISITDDVAFRTIAETCNTLFGAGYENIQQSCFVPATFREKYGSEYKAWFPKLAIENKAVSKGWNNKLSQDGENILEFNESPGWLAHDSQTKPNEVRVTFTQAQDPITRKREYRFVGVFKFSGVKENKNIYKRVEDSFPLIKPAT